MAFFSVKIYLRKLNIHTFMLKLYRWSFIFICLLLWVLNFPASQCSVKKNCVFRNLGYFPPFISLQESAINSRIVFCNCQIGTTSSLKIGSINISPPRINLSKILTVAQGNAEPPVAFLVWFQGAYKMYNHIDPTFLRNHQAVNLAFVEQLASDMQKKLMKIDGLIKKNEWTDRDS